MNSYEESEEISNKEPENENSPLASMEIIELNSDVKKRKSPKFNWKDWINYGYISILIILVIFALLFSGPFVSDENYHLVSYKYKNERKNSTKIGDHNSKLNIAFYYPTITKFMVSTAEVLNKAGNYNIVFLTKTSEKYNSNYNTLFKIINVKDSQNLLKKAIKDENIEYLFINNKYTKNEIDWFKSLGIKLIGVFDEVFSFPNKSNTTKLYRDIKILESYDAFVHTTADNYLGHKKIGFKNSIFIPKFFEYNSKTKETKEKNHNIIMEVGEISKNKNDLISIITGMSSIVKKFSDTILNIFISSTPSQEISKLVSIFKLEKNIVFHNKTSNFSECLTNSSIAIFTSLTNNYTSFINEAKSYGLPCIVSMDNTSIYEFKKGVEKVDISSYDEFSKEILKLFKDKKYNKQLGQKAKLSLDNFNLYILKAWNALFKSLKNEEEFQNLRNKMENKLINMVERLETKHTKSTNITSKNHTSHYHKIKTKKIKKEKKEKKK